MQKSALGAKLSTIGVSSTASLGGEARCAFMPCRKSERVAFNADGRRRNAIRQSLLVALRLGAARLHFHPTSDVAAGNR